MSGELALAIGKFDALHRGHRALIEAAARLGAPALLNFTGMAEALGWEPRAPVVAERDRTRVLATWPGAPGELDLDFAQVRSLDLDGFVGLLVERFQPGVLVVGADFRGGLNRSGGADELAVCAERRGIATTALALVADGNGIISTTRVRACLAAGDVAAAAQLLGRPHAVLGTVARGDGRGRAIGIPTANLSDTNLLPAHGVYAAVAHLDGRRFPAAVNIGVLPTIGADRATSCEAHLVGFDGDCYGRELRLDVIARLRGEQRFASLDALVQQIRRDIAAVERSVDAHIDVGQPALHDRT